MGLFDDDFYSTKVSRRARTAHREHYQFPRRSKDWGPVRLAAVSSVSGAAVAVLMFAVIFGMDHGDEAHTAGAIAQTADPLQQTVSASAKVRPAVVSILNEQRLAAEEAPGGIAPEDGAGGDGAGSNAGQPADPGQAPEESASGGDGAGNADEADQAGGSLDIAGADGSGVNGLQESSVGSGVIFSKKGGKAYIITNNHVVADAVTVKAVLQSGEERTATVVGTDPVTDLAVLAIDDKGIDTVAKIGDSSKLQSGEMVMAIGNPLGLGESLTMGVVSKTKQIIPVSLNQDGIYDWEQEVIQTDASINQGNSGGPLIDLYGNVIGINSMKISDLGVEGVGFALPINNVMPVIDNLIAYGRVPRPYLGVYTMDLSQYFAQMSFGIEGGSGSGDGNGAEEGSGTGEQDGSDSGSGADGGPGAEGGGHSGGAEGSAPGSGDPDGSGSEGTFPWGEDPDGTDLGSADSDDPGALNLPPTVKEGVIVLEAVGPAKEAGFQFNDVIVKLDNQTIGSTMELRKYLYGKKKIGDKLLVTFYREGKQHTESITLAEKSDEEE